MAAIHNIGGLALAALVLGSLSGRPQAATPLPDITGVWAVEPAYNNDIGRVLTPAPELTPAAIAARDRLAAARAKGYVRGVSSMLCKGGGGPELSMFRSPFEVFSGFGRVTFVFETENFNQPRTVYLWEKTQPDNIFPSANGHSIGHWDARTLVVDTIGYNGRSAFGGVTLSERAHTVERFSLSDDGKVLTDEVTVQDPVSFATPWTVPLKFDRQPDSEERFEVSCDVDLQALKSVDLDAVKDADPAAARLLDPAQRGDDPALQFAPTAAPRKNPGESQHAF